MNREDPLDVIAFDTASEFLDTAASNLYAREDINNSMISLVDTIVEDQGFFSEPFHFAAVRNKNGAQIGFLVHAKPEGLLTCGLDVSHADLVYEWAMSEVGLPNRISGNPDLIAELAQRLIVEHGVTISIQNLWNVYRIDEVPEETEQTSGLLRPAEGTEESLIRAWGESYASEKPAFISIADFYSRKLRRGELFVWDDEGVKTIITISGKTNNGLRISSAYTPPQFRGRGYAHAAVTTVCRNAMHNGTRFVTLTAEDQDPVEKLYRRIGFYSIGQQSSYVFGPDKD